MIRWSRLRLLLVMVACGALGLMLGLHVTPVQPIRAGDFVLFEDGSWTQGSTSGCLPGALCDEGGE